VVLFHFRWKEKSDEEAKEWFDEESDRLKPKSEFEIHWGQQP
jgi:hypothetical protein